jgi:hypothetical protein
MPFEEPVEVARIFEPEAEGNLLDRHIHLPETHTGILYHPVEDKNTGRLAGVAHANGVESVFADAEGIRVAFDAPMLPVAELDELPELLKHIVTCASQTSLCGCITSIEAPDMKADESEMSAEDRHGRPVGGPHLPEQGLKGMGDFFGAIP